MAETVKAKKWILAKEFSEGASFDNFELVEEALSTELKDGELLVQTLYWSVDPYMRIWPQAVGDAMLGDQVAIVTASKSKKYPTGSHVLGRIGWRTHAIISEDLPILELSPDTGSFPKSLALGILGLTGMSAYVGVFDVLKLKAGEVLVVSAAAGAVGNVVGQMGKIMGCKVIGFCGSEEKCAWLKDELKFDHVFNYKTIALEEAMREAAPDGVDCYFDNVGGEFCNKMVSQMKDHGRIACCGSISTYQFANQPQGPFPYLDIVLKRLRVEGFIAFDRFEDLWPEGRRKVLGWLESGQMTNKERVVEGFENMPKAFLELFQGTNIGKIIVKP